MTLMKVDWSVYVVADPQVTAGRSLVEVVRAAVAGGATLVQLRAKKASTRELVEMGCALHQITLESGVPFIINDRLDVALAVDAEGVHMGLDDMPVALARQILGSGKLLGASAGTVAEAIQAARDGADHISVGDIFGTRNKADAGVPIGVNCLAEIAAAVTVPVVAIGGITLENAAAAVRAGAEGVAVISAVMSATDPAAAARALGQVVCMARRERSRRA